MQAHIRWDLDRSSQYHFREWDDGVALFLEGENSISLINDFAKYLLTKFDNGQQTFQSLLALVRADYPNDSLDDISQLLESTLVELGKRGILVRTRS